MSTVVSMTFSRARGISDRLHEPIRAVMSSYCKGVSRGLSTTQVVSQEGSVHPARRERQQEAALYVHWPYCSKRCSYCNFNKYISKDVDHKRMRECLTRETESLLRLSEVKRVKSIFFGGGTPSLALAETLGSVIETVAKTTHLPADAEITMEVNPTSTSESKLRGFRDAGINRVSVGLQTLHNKALRILGREHNAQEAILTLEECKKLFPGRTSVDVIFALPGQTAKGLEHELNQILPLADDHISLYQLTLERGTTLFTKVMNRGVVMPSSGGVADMYELAVQMLEEDGFHRYEASNFARHEKAESVHNKSYWRGEQYIGVGPGAHGRFIPWGAGTRSREARVQTLEPEPWMSEVQQNGHATRKATAQTNRENLEELLMTGLRTSEGIPAKTWNAVSEGPTLYEAFSEAYVTRLLVDEGLLLINRRGMKATHKGLNVADNIVSDLLNVLGNHYEMDQAKKRSSV